MRKVLFMAVSALLICTSCVTKKKYLEAENGRLEAIGRGNALQEQLVDCKDAADKLNERLASSGTRQRWAATSATIRRC